MQERRTEILEAFREVAGGTRNIRTNNPFWPTHYFLAFTHFFDLLPQFKWLTLSTLKDVLCIGGSWTCVELDRNSFTTISISYTANSQYAPLDRLRLRAAHNFVVQFAEQKKQNLPDLQKFLTLLFHGLDLNLFKKARHLIVPSRIPKKGQPGWSEYLHTLELYLSKVHLPNGSAIIKMLVAELSDPELHDSIVEVLKLFIKYMDISS